MEVKDQIRTRMDEQKMSVAELAQRLQVSNQTVRHWLSGRSFPGKSKAPALEKALSFRLDYSQGATVIEADADRIEIEVLLAISKLPPDIKKLFYQLAVAFNRRGDNSVVATSEIDHSQPTRG
jgi:transcriptional regulator with XRE-family HTH domain